ncbi:MAG TPA: hypothetical protein VG898_11130, partial [Solirubrobacterales bacterium]|nr:hypothetical protein [Solirubrobacterales bacterium]
MLAAAFVLLPTAQAFAHETLKVEIEGEGALVSAGPTYEGTPPIDCHSPTQLGDVCEDEMSDEGEGYEAVNLKALPASGWEFVEWVIVEGTAEACEEISGFNYCLAYSEPPGSGGATVKAVFAEESGPPQPLTIEVEGDGEVTGTGITCTETGNGTAACEEEFAEGTQVPLTATADIGSHFVGWTTLEGDAGSCTAATASCETGELNAPAKLKAVFAENPPQPLIVEVEGEGEVSATEPPNPVSGEIDGCEEAAGECSAEYAEGIEVPLTATAETGWHFVGWTTLEGDAGSC